MNNINEKCFTCPLPECIDCLAEPEEKRKPGRPRRTPEQIAEAIKNAKTRQEKSYLIHLEKRQEKAREYYYNNIEVVQARNRAYKESHKEELAEKNRERRAKKRMEG